MCSSKKYPKPETLMGLLLSRLLKSEAVASSVWQREVIGSHLSCLIYDLRRYGWRIEKRKTTIPATGLSGGCHTVKQDALYWMRPRTIRKAGATGKAYIEAVEQTAKCSVSDTTEEV